MHYIPQRKIRGLRRLTGLNRPVFWLFAAMFLGNFACGAQETGQWGEKFECEAHGELTSEACKALDLYKQGKMPAETPLAGVRLVDVGYLATSDGKLENQLLVIEFS
ncbi:MAG TPA: hypothetical protein VGE00_06325, partial [Gammaproteobacteria bacterium]